jgi:hypothetical protein
LLFTGTAHLTFAEALPVHGAEASSRRPGTRRRPPCEPQLDHLLGAALHPPPPAGLGPDVQPERPRTEVVEVNPAVLDKLERQPPVHRSLRLDMQPREARCQARPPGQR